MKSVHDLAIESLVHKLRGQGKNAVNNHKRHKGIGRIPDVVVSSPSELYEVEVLSKRSLPKKEGTKRFLIIVTSLDWEGIFVTSDEEYLEAERKIMNLHYDFHSEIRRLNGLRKKYEKRLELLKARIKKYEDKIANLQIDAHLTRKSWSNRLMDNLAIEQKRFTK